MRIVYDPRYSIRALGADRLHPFDIRKHARAWDLLCRNLGPRLDRCWRRPEREANRDDLLTVHTPGYLDSLRQPATVAAIVEVSILASVPHLLLDRCLLRPMRWATAGTVLAAREALTTAGCAGVINLSGGYHHASSTRGEGFCVYNDITIAIRALRQRGDLASASRVLYIDLDAHQGNGVARDVVNDRKVFIFDMYNAGVYPGDREARRRIDCDLPLRPGTGGRAYLDALQHHLPQFLDATHRTDRPTLAFYNAGTDPYERDALGGLRLSFEDILARDRFVIDELTARAIPWVLVPSGGYSPESYRMIAATAEWAVCRSTEQRDE